MSRTTRASRTIDITNDQLRFLGIDFTVCSPLTLEVELPIENQYKDGIWFIERNKKGHSVRKWLDTLPVHPQKIILVDDTYRHVKNMEENLSDLGIEFVGIHYTKAHKHPYRADIAQKQAEYFPEILTDEEASQRLRGYSAIPNGKIRDYFPPGRTVVSGGILANITPETIVLPGGK